MHMLRALAAQVKAEKIADSEEVGGKAVVQPRHSSLLPPSSTAHAMMHPQQRRVEAQDVSRFAPSHAPSQGAGRWPQPFHCTAVSLILSAVSFRCGSN